MRANDSTAAAAGLGRGWHLFTVLVYQNSTKVYCCTHTHMRMRRGVVPIHSLFTSEIEVMVHLSFDLPQLKPVGKEFDRPAATTQQTVPFLPN